MALNTLALLKERLSDVAGDTTSGFWSVANQTRVINDAREELWGENWYITLLSYTFDAVANQSSYPLTTIEVPRFGDFDHLEYWQSPTTDTDPTYIYKEVGPNQFKTLRDVEPVFTYRNEGTSMGNTRIFLRPVPQQATTNGFVLYYFPSPETMTDGDAVVDPLITAYPLSAEYVVYKAAADMRRQEGLFDEAEAFSAMADDTLQGMRKALMRKVPQRSYQLRVDPY